MSATAIIIWITLSFVTVAILGIWIMNKIIYKHTVIIRDQGNNDLVLIDKARDYSKDGVKYWRLLKEKDKELRLLPIPASSYIDIAKRGKKLVECVRSPEGNYEYIQIDSQNFKVLQPLTSKQRMIMMNNFRKANERKGFSWKEHIPMLASVGMLGVVIIFGMIFWGEIAAPALDARKIGMQEQTIQKETLEIIRDIKLNQQTITDRITSIENKMDVPD